MLRINLLAAVLLNPAHLVYPFKTQPPATHQNYFNSQP